MASQASSPPPPGARWSDLVKASLHPRLLRLPLLGFTLVHSLLAATYLPSTLASGSLLDFVLLPIRPAIALASLLAFALGVMPLLVVRRRILARTRWHQALVSPHEAPFASPASLLSRPNPSTLKAVANCLAHSSTWTSALLSGITASAFTLPLLAAFAFASKDPLAWSPYQQVPSVRKVSSSGTFGGVRSHTTTTLYWRPNEVVFALALQPFFLGVLASLASTIFQDWPIPPLRIPVFPFLATVEAIEAGAASGPAPSSSLAARVTATVPRRVAAAAAQYALLSTAILTLYLPVRLPLFRLVLLLLPPYSTLRRLVIPSLQPQYSIYSAGNLAFLFGTAALLAAILGAAQSLAANLWEIYATHPLAIVASGNPALIMAAPPRTPAGPAPAAASTPGVETLLEALEVFASTSPLPNSTASAYGAQERHFLFMHALLDLASLAQHLAAEGDSSSSEKQRRGQFWKHFAVPATAAAAGGAGGTTVSAWERVSEVGLREIKAILEAQSGATSSGEQKPAQAAANAAPPKATTTVAIEPASRALKAAAPSTSTAVTQARPEAPAATTSGSQAMPAQPTTIWQRLLAPPPSASTSSSSSTAVTQQRPQSTGTPSASTQPPATTTPTTPTSSISTLLTRFFGPNPPSNSSSASPHPTSASAAKPSLTLSAAPLLLLLLGPYSAQTLLLLSLREDEWGSVTLSERRGLGVEAWQRVAAQCRGVSPVPSATTGQTEEKTNTERKQERQREWDVAREEVERRSGMIGSEFGTTMGGGQSG